MSGPLQKAREFEENHRPLYQDDLPEYHLTGGVGWINDPNGFAPYQGEYHLFYQYYPYDTVWGPMHWGHAKTKDFIHWEQLPAALAPEQDYDRDGCFSGGAVEMPDGRHLLMYTGVSMESMESSESGESDEFNDASDNTDGRDGSKGIDDSDNTDDSDDSDGSVGVRPRRVQTQCLAIGDGIDYLKYDGNPVIDRTLLPEGGSSEDFRDPKIWREDDSYYALVANRCEKGGGSILLFQSQDVINWRLKGIVAQSRGRYGRMWECPDLFRLDGKDVLLVSSVGMTAVDQEFHPGYTSICLIGERDQETGQLREERIQSIDYGLDFYAPQTLQTADGRRVMIAWMQNWATVGCKPEAAGFFGQMTLPRELSVKGGRLLQNPVRELEAARRRRVSHENVIISEECSLPGIAGRHLDLTLTIKAAEKEDIYQRFTIKLAKAGDRFTRIDYIPSDAVIRLDRTCSGLPYDIVNSRQFPVSAPEDPGTDALTIRIIMDTYSIELFVNGGEQAASLVIYTGADAEEISFLAQGKALLDIEKYDLETAEI